MFKYLAEPFIGLDDMTKGDFIVFIGGILSIGFATGISVFVF